MPNFETISGQSYQQPVGLLTRALDHLPFGSRRAAGLDLGRRRMHAVGLERRSSGVMVKVAASERVPEDASTEGRLTDGPAVADVVRRLFESEKQLGRKVTVALGGDTAYCGFERIDDPSYEPAELVRTKVESIIPYNFDSAYCDYQVLDSSYETEHSSLIWACAPADEVEWARETVRLAGLSPAAADLRACALVNVFAYNYAPSGDETVLLLDAGEDVVTMALTRGGVPLMSRSVTVTEPWFAAEPSSPASRARGALAEHWASFVERAKPLSIAKVYLCGDDAASEGLSDGVCVHTGLEIVYLDPFLRLETGETCDDRVRYAAAVGLALRGLKDL